MAIIVNGQEIAQNLAKELKEKFSKLNEEIRLAIIQVGENEASKSFILQKLKFAQLIGVKVRIYKFPENITTRNLRKRVVEISKIKKNKAVIVQLPLPSHINESRVLNAINQKKDVDVLNERNLGKLVSNRFKILPPAVLVIKKIFKEFYIDIKDKNIVVVGFGKLIGRPISIYLLNQGVTLSVLNINTRNLSDFTKNADILISGVGKANLITVDMVKKGAIVIDFGFSKIDKKIVGDVDFEKVKEKAFLITKTPGGTGPILVAMIFKNLLDLVRF